jgi:disulfide bond formation protein DsbB
MMMQQRLKEIARSRWYWLFLVAVGVSFIAVALYYQYVLDELPCVLCIQVRIWISCLVITALAALVFHNRVITLSSHLLTVVISAGLLERSYQLLGTERGFVFSDCGFDPGLPVWLALDQWFPAMYRVEASCGYTPELVFGISMAEGLLVLSAALLLISLIFTTVSCLRQNH